MVTKIGGIKKKRHQETILYLKKIVFAWSVSYTHLDVYKRQDFMLSEFLDVVINAYNTFFPLS